jgi:hypothetical protein
VFTAFSSSFSYLSWRLFFFFCLSFVIVISSFLSYCDVDSCARNEVWMKNLNRILPLISFIDSAGLKKIIRSLIQFKSCLTTEKEKSSWRHNKFASVINEYKYQLVYMSLVRNFGGGGGRNCTIGMKYAFSSFLLVSRGFFSYLRRMPM